MSEPKSRTGDDTLGAMTEPIKHIVEATIIVGQKERVGAWVAARVGHRAQWGTYEAIGMEQDGELVAGVVFDGYVKDARCCMHVAGVGGTWLTREYLWCCFDYAFRQLGCKVVIGLVDSNNDPALRFDRHLGFEEVARIKDGAGDCDLLVLAMRREQCRWLTMREQRDEELATTRH